MISRLLEATAPGGGKEAPLGRLRVMSGVDDCPQGRRLDGPGGGSYFGSGGLKFLYRSYLHQHDRNMTAHRSSPRNLFIGSAETIEALRRAIRCPSSGGDGADW